MQNLSEIWKVTSTFIDMEMMKRAKVGLKTISLTAARKSLKMGIPLRPVPLTAMVGHLSLIWTTRQKNTVQF